MKEDQDYIRDIAEMRSMMERSSKFMSLSGLAGVMAGVYALAGAFAAYQVLHFNPDQISYAYYHPMRSPGYLWQVVILAIVILFLAVGTAIFLSNRKAAKRQEKVYNATARRLLLSMAVPLVAGGFLILIMIAQGLLGLVIPFTLLFYGLALYNAGRYTFVELRSLGLIQVGLGLISACFPGYALLFWALGFGVLHIVYGIYMHYRYER